MIAAPTPEWHSKTDMKWRLFIIPGNLEIAVNDVGLLVCIDYRDCHGAAKLKHKSFMIFA
jgi:hypothetical protein